MLFHFDTNKLKEMDLDVENQIINGKIINRVSTINHPLDKSILFITNVKKINIDLMEKIKDSLLIVNSMEGLTECIVSQNDILLTKNPRLTYALLLTNILSDDSVTNEFHHQEQNIYIGKNVKIGENVKIEPNVTIGDNVSIGDNSRILSGVRINNNVIIGKETVIRNNSVIGSQGFGIEKDQNGRTIRIPHVGSVIIGNYVDIGSLNTVVSGTIEPTIIEDYVMTDDHVHIAHNCYIGSSTLITACVEISGSVNIGKNVYIGPNSSIINKIKIDDNVIIGINSLVNKNVQSGVTVSGIPAKEIGALKEERMKIKSLLNRLSK